MGREADALASRWLTVAGRPMHARVSVGSPPAATAVVLVHGLSISSRYEVPAARRLAPDFRVFAPDLPGFGRSAGPPRALPIEGLAEALGGWLDAAGLDRVALVGNSLGGKVVAELAAAAPHRVDRLVLSGLTLDPGGRSRRVQAVRALRDLPREPRSLWALQVADFFAAGPRRVWDTLGHALRHQLEDALPRVLAPTLVLRGGRDPMAPQAWTEEVARRLPNGRSAVIPGAPHAVNYSAPDAFARAVAAFLREDESGG